MPWPLTPATCELTESYWIGTSWGSSILCWYCVFSHASPFPLWCPRRAGRELQLSGFTLFFNSDQFHNALNGCPAQTETFSVDGDIPGISTEVPGLSWDSNTPGFDDGTHAGLKIKKGVHSGIFMDRVSDKKHEVKFKYQGAEGWGAYIDNNPNAPGSGSQVVVMVGTTIVGKLAGNFKGFYGFLSPTPFDEVTIMRDSDATSGQETFTVDNLSIIPWCSIFPGIHGDPHIKVRSLVACDGHKLMIWVFHLACFHLTHSCSSSI